MIGWAVLCRPCWPRGNLVKMSFRSLLRGSPLPHRQHVTAAGVLGFVNFSSSAVSDVLMRFCSGPPSRLENVLASKRTKIVLSAALTL